VISISRSAEADENDCRYLAKGSRTFPSKCGVPEAPPSECQSLVPNSHQLTGRGGASKEFQIFKNSSLILYRSRWYCPSCRTSRTRRLGRQGDWKPPETQSRDRLTAFQLALVLLTLVLLVALITDAVAPIPRAGPRECRWWQSSRAIRSKWKRVAYRNNWKMKSAPAYGPP